MNKLIFLPVYIATIIIGLSSCSTNNSTSNQELSNPLTVKGMKLGLNYEKQVKIGEENGLCKSEFKNSKCHYNLTETIMAQPKLSYSLYNDEKVLDKVELTLYSPFNFPFVEDENGNVLAEYPSLTNEELEEVKSMYTSKYGSPKLEKWEHGGSASWEVNNEMVITLNYTTTQYAAGFMIHPQVRDAFVDNAFTTTVTYEYVDNIKSLLKEATTHDDEPLGDKI